MSQLGCHCGAVISNVAYPSPTEGEVRSQQDQERGGSRIEKTVADFLSAVAEGRRAEWLGRFFAKEYPTELNDGSVVADIRAKFEDEFAVRASECAACGRLYIQRRPHENSYVCFEPRSGRYEGVLARKTEE